METLKCSPNPSNGRLNSNYCNINKFVPEAFGNKRSTRDFQCSHSVRGPFYQTIGHGTSVLGKSVLHLPSALQSAVTQTDLALQGKTIFI